MTPKLAAAFAAFLLAAVAVAAAVPSAAKRPNVVVFITDDESWLERGAYGWSNIPTPHFDRVAREGVLFTRGFTSAPSCAPSRAALLTGRNFWELEQGAFIQAWLPGKFPALPELMEAGGYHAGYSGKGWGPGVVPKDSGRTRNPAGDAYNSVKRPTREPGISDIDYPANLAKFLDERPTRKPFWFWVGSIEPHTPLGPDNYRKFEAQTGLKETDLKIPEFLPQTPGVRRQRANLAYEICHADRDLGRVLALLEERGELANTLLIVTADNGTQVLRSKTNLYDWGVRVPLAMMWPAQVKGGRRVDDFVNFADLAPTMLEATGLPVPNGMSGRSVLDVLTSGKSGRVDPARSWTAAGVEWHGEAAPVSLAGRMIRNERYLYIVNYSDAPRRAVDPSKQRPDAEYAKNRETDNEIDLTVKHPAHPEVKRFTAYFVDPRPREELYDSETDPWQLNNLAASPAHAGVKAKLRDRLEAYQRQTRDPRITGEMEIFEQTRAFVSNRKFGAGGYGEK
jgi:uncharacterized sulfatase